MPSLNRLRVLRVARTKDTALGPEFERMRADLSRRRRSGGGAEAVWEVVVPDALREKAEVVGLSRGVLRVRARHASARFELDRFLRSGGEAALIRAATVAIKRVRVLA